MLSHHNNQLPLSNIRLQPREWLLQFSKELLLPKLDHSQLKLPTLLLNSLQSKLNQFNTSPHHNSQFTLNHQFNNNSLLTSNHQLTHITLSHNNSLKHHNISSQFMSNHQFSMSHNLSLLNHNTTSQNLNTKSLMRTLSQSMRVSDLHMHHQRSEPDSPT